MRWPSGYIDAGSACSAPRWAARNRGRGMDLERALRISATGMAAQSTRLRVVAENLANRDSTGETPGADPYRRKTVTFGSRLDRALGAETVEVRRIGTAPGDFPEVHDPGHPAADARGYVKRPNVDSL